MNIEWYADYVRIRMKDICESFLRRINPRLSS